MDDDGTLGVGHVRGEPRHREVGRRAPQERLGADHRLDLPVAGRLHLGVLDDRLHHGGAGASAVARSSWAETRARTSSTAEGSTAPISASVDALAQPIVQRVDDRRGTRPVPHSRPTRTAARTDGRCSPHRQDRSGRPAFVRQSRIRKVASSHPTPARGGSRCRAPGGAGPNAGLMPVVALPRIVQRQLEKGS